MAHSLISGRVARLLAGLGLAIALAAMLPAASSAFPTKPITIVVPFAAGGPSDTIARIFAVPLGQSLGGQVIVENVAGAGSTIGIARVAKSEPDGHTLLLSHISHATTATLFKKLSYDPVNDFAPIGMVTDGALVLVGRKDFPATTLAELFAKIKADGEKLAYAHAGTGSGSHLCGLMVMQAAGNRMTQVPYRGNGPAMNDVVSGKVDLLCDQVTSALPQIQGKAVKAFAVTAAEPIAGIDAPTFAAAGAPNIRATIWHGLYAPRGTPDDVIAKLNAALRAALKDPAIVKRLDELSTIPATEAQAQPAFLKQHLAKEIVAWKAIIESSGLQPE